MTRLLTLTAVVLALAVPTSVAAAASPDPVHARYLKPAHLPRPVRRHGTKEGAR